MPTVKSLAPDLENGAVMTREEFHAAYAECEAHERVELIEGVVYLPSPIKIESHAQPQALMLVWLSTYAIRDSALLASGPASVLLDDHNEPEPDALLLRKTPGWLSADGFVAKAPELVVEVAATSKSRDLNQKMAAYERAGVKEYIVWRAADGAIDWFTLIDGAFTLRDAREEGRIESQEFPGLVLDVAAMLALDAVRVLAALR